MTRSPISRRSSCIRLGIGSPIVLYSPATASDAHTIPASNPASGAPAANARFIAANRFRPFASKFICASLSI